MVRTQAEIKALIDQYITTNGEQEITGATLNAVLQAIADESGYTFDIQVYPQDAALEFTFYNPDTPDGEVLKINADVSNLGNSKLEAISAWWAAQKERRINVIGGYDIEIASLTTSSQNLGPFKFIESGQIIASFTNATELVFGVLGGGSVTINASDLPYKATQTLQNVSTANGTASNVKIHVNGADNGSVSVSQNNQTGHTEIHIGSNDYPVASVEEVEDIDWNINGQVYDGEFSATAGSAVPALSTRIAVNIANGKQFNFRLDSQVTIKSGTFTCYYWGSDNVMTALGLVSFNQDYQFTAPTDIKYLGIYISSADASGTFTMTALVNVGLTNRVSALESGVTALGNNLNATNNRVTTIESKVGKDWEASKTASQSYIIYNDSKVPVSINNGESFNIIISENSQMYSGEFSLRYTDDVGNDGVVLATIKFNKEYSLVAPANIKYLGIYIGSLTNTGTYTYNVWTNTDFIKRNEFQQLDNRTKKNELLQSLALRNVCKDVLCVGDSVTRGLVSDYPNTGTFVGCSYPDFLANITRWNVTNGGVTGITIENWYKNELSKYTMTNYQMVIIELGYNDNDLTNTIATDVMPYDNPEDYAQNAMGYYCRLVETILSANPNITLFIVNPSLYQPISEKYKAIKSIADYYELPFIDLNKTDYINLSANALHGKLEESSADRDYVHFNRIGYVYKAMLMYYDINNWWGNNIAEANKCMIESYSTPAT